MFQELYCAYIFREKNFNEVHLCYINLNDTTYWYLWLNSIERGWGKTDYLSSEDVDPIPPSNLFQGDTGLLPSLPVRRCLINYIGSKG